MAPCCTGTITPKMIKRGEMKIGDRIQFDEIPVSAPAAPASEPVSAPTAKMEMPPVEVQTEPVSAPVSAAAASISEPVSAPAASSEISKDATSKEASKEVPETVAVQAPMPSRQADWQIQARQAQQDRPQEQQDRQQARQESRQPFPTPLNFQQMTPYMDRITITNNGDVPFIAVPQTPLTTENFSETIDITDVQAYLGFLRTQIGRYMRIEQLVGSDTIENRYGFLVGIGSNFIILQEITTGNIMVIDLFSIRLTYIYYSEPVFPGMTPQ